MISPTISDLIQKRVLECETSEKDCITVSKSVSYEPEKHTSIVTNTFIGSKIGRNSDGACVGLIYLSTLDKEPSYYLLAETNGNYNEYKSDVRYYHLRVIECSEVDDRRGYYICSNIRKTEKRRLVNTIKDYLPRYVITKPNDNDNTIVNAINISYRDKNTYYFTPMEKEVFKFIYILEKIVERKVDTEILISEKISYYCLSAGHFKIISEQDLITLVDIRKEYKLANYKIVHRDKKVFLSPLMVDYSKIIYYTTTYTPMRKQVDVTQAKDYVLTRYHSHALYIEKILGMLKDSLCIIKQSASKDGDILIYFSNFGPCVPGLERISITQEKLFKTFEEIIAPIFTNMIGLSHVYNDFKIGDDFDDVTAEFDMSKLVTTAFTNRVPNLKSAIDFFRVIYYYAITGKIHFNTFILTDVVEALSTISFDWKKRRDDLYEEPVAIPYTLYPYGRVEETFDYIANYICKKYENTELTMPLNARYRNMLWRSLSSIYKYVAESEAQPNVRTKARYRRLKKTRSFFDCLQSGIFVSKVRAKLIWPNLIFEPNKNNRDTVHKIKINFYENETARLLLPLLQHITSELYCLKLDKSDLDSVFRTNRIKCMTIALFAYFAKIEPNSAKQYIKQVIYLMMNQMENKQVYKDIYTFVTTLDIKLLLSTIEKLFTNTQTFIKLKRYCLSGGLLVPRLKREVSHSNNTDKVVFRYEALFSNVLSIKVSNTHSNAMYKFNPNVLALSRFSKDGFIGNMAYLMIMANVDLKMVDIKDTEDLHYLTTYNNICRYIKNGITGSKDNNASKSKYKLVLTKASILYYLSHFNSERLRKGRERQYIPTTHNDKLLVYDALPFEIMPHTIKHRSSLFY